MGLLNAAKHKMLQWLIAEPKSKSFPLCDFDRIQYEVRVGDVLLIEGKSRISYVIRSITQSAWSHAVLYVGRLHDIEDPKLRQLVRQFYAGPAEEQLIIESMMGKGTVVSPLKIYNKAHIRICRPKGISHEDAQHVIGFAIKRLGRDYGIRHNFDLARWLFPWTLLPRRWRSSLFRRNVSESTQEICSSMLAEAFKSVSYPILPIVKSDKNNKLTFYHRNPRLFTPSDFDYSPYFEIIKYPMFELSSHAVYRNLPWSDQKEVYTDESEIPESQDKLAESEGDKDNRDDKGKNKPVDKSE